LKMSRMIFGMLLCAALGLLPAAAQDQQSSTPGETTQAKAGTDAGSGSLSAADRAFVKKAAQGGKAEVELGQLATEKASSDAVKKFGQRMVDDHTKANEQLQALAAKENVTLPDKPNAQQRQEKARLEKLSGEQFDRAYMRLMVQDHTKDVAEFQRESKSAKDPGVKDFASTTLPTLKEHLSLAKKTASGEQAQASSK
jgi:putative membrane protein